MKVGIIGAGTVGSSLGKALLKAGHEVMFSSRDPQGGHAQRLSKETGAPVGSIQETLAFAPIVVIAMDANTVPGMIKANPQGWANKAIIDLNNRMLTTPTRENSLSHEIARLTKGKVVKALNTIGAEHYQNPVFDGEKATMFIAGDDKEAKKMAGQLISDIGFDVVDVGGLDNSDLLDNLARFWVHMAYQTGMGRNVAFRLIRR